MGRTKFFLAVHISIVCTIISSVTCVRSSCAEGFDLARDFSADHNPAGPWSYGAEPELNGPMTL